MLIVMSMEDGTISRETVAPTAEMSVMPPVDYPQPQTVLQEYRLPPSAVYPPPPLDIEAFLAKFD